MRYMKDIQSEIKYKTANIYYETYKQEVEKYADEIAKIKTEMANDPGNTTLIDRYKELLSSQRDAISNMQQEKNAIKDLAENGYNKLLESLNKLIEKYKEALNNQKSLYDYENSISDQNSTINSLKKQILAYSSGNDTEENRATLQKLSVELKDAQKSLQESEYEKYISDQEQLLDNFQNDLEEWINARLDNIELLFQEAIDNTNLNGSLINDTLNQVASNVNYTTTDEFTKIWSSFNDPSGLTAQTRDILTNTDYVCNDIKNGVYLLPTQSGLEAYLSGENLQIISQITNTESAVNNVQSAIRETNSAISQIASRIAEYNSSILRAFSSVQTAAEKAQQAANNAQQTANNAQQTANAAKSAASNTSNNTTTTNKTGNTNTTGSKNNYWVEGYDKWDHRFFKNDLTYQDAQNIAAEYRKKGYTIFVRHYAKGGIVPDENNPLDVIAKSIGEDHMVATKEGERILTKEQNANFEKLANNRFVPIDSKLNDKIISLSDFIGNMNKDNFITPFNSSKMKLDSNINTSSNYNNTTNVGDVNISLPNVTNKEEFVTWLKNDGQIEKIIQTMTLGKMTGKNSYTKLKY